MKSLSSISHFYPVTRIIIVLFALFISITPLPNTLLQIISIVLILGIGIMHGATDHVLFLMNECDTIKHKIPKLFFTRYFLLLGAMGFIWWLAPLPALIIFLAISAYHFGQTQLQYLPMREKHLGKKILYLFWGASVLGMLIFGSTETSVNLLQSAFPNAQWLPFLLDNGQWIFGISFVTSLLTIPIFAYKLGAKASIIEGVELLIIALFSYSTDLLISFALFFGLWHSLRATQLQIGKIARHDAYNLKHFIIQSLPFFVISLFGIGLLYMAGFYFQQQIVPEMLFLIAISMLSMPHIIIYDKFFSKFQYS